MILENDWCSSINKQSNSSNSGVVGRCPIRAIDECIQALSGVVGRWLLVSSINKGNWWVHSGVVGRCWALIIGFEHQRPNAIINCPYWTTPYNARIKQSTPDKWILSDSGNVGRWLLVSSINRLLMIINEWILILESLFDLSSNPLKKWKWLLMLETNNQRPTLPESTQIRASIMLNDNDHQ